MANTSLTLGEHWEGFIKSKLQDGRYGSASELVRDSLRLLEERELKREQLVQALIEGENSGSAGALDMDAVKQKARDIVIPTIHAINERRIENGISQSALYSKANVTHRTWFDGLQGRIGNNANTLIKLNTALEALISKNSVKLFPSS